MAFNNPMGEAQYEQIRQALRDIEELETFLAKARQAGMNVEAISARILEQRTRLSKLRDVFFPGR